MHKNTSNLKFLHKHIFRITHIYRYKNLFLNLENNSLINTTSKHFDIGKTLVFSTHKKCRRLQW